MLHYHSVMQDLSILHVLRIWQSGSKQAGTHNVQCKRLPQYQFSHSCYQNVVVDLPTTFGKMFLLADALG